VKKASFKYSLGNVEDTRGSGASDRDNDDSDWLDEAD
jgi:hypothetical protein